jgi:hypothetical protein
MNVASNADHHIRLLCICQRRVVCVETSGCVRTGEILEGNLSSRQIVYYIYACAWLGVRQMAGGLALEKPRTDGR